MKNEDLVHVASKVKLETEEVKEWIQNRKDSLEKTLKSNDAMRLNLRQLYRHFLGIDKLSINSN